MACHLAAVRVPVFVVGLDRGVDTLHRDEEKYAANYVVDVYQRLHDQY